MTSVRRDGDGYLVESSDEPVHARAVVIASGACNLPSLPSFAPSLPESIVQATPFDYREPSDLPDGGVLVEQGAAREVLKHPQHARTQDFLRRVLHPM